MGSCFSCCRRRKSPEREPLLPQHRQEEDEVPVLNPPTSPLEKLVDVLGALKAGKVPSQAQLNNLITEVLASEVLDAHSGLGNGYGPVSDDVRKVVLDVRECLQVVLDAGGVINHDDVLQELWFEASEMDAVPVKVDADVNIDEGVLVDIQENVQPPSIPELTSDISTLTASTRTILTLLLTSSSFRLLLSTLLGSVREIVAGTAGAVASVSSKIEEGAREVEEAARLDDLTFEGVRVRTKEAAGDAANEGVKAAAVVGEAGQNARDAVVGRIQESLALANRNPRYRAALSSVLRVFQKYVQLAERAADALPTGAEGVKGVEFGDVELDVDAHLERALHLGRTVLERVAGKSMEPLLASLRALMAHLYTHHMHTHNGTDLPGHQDPTSPSSSSTHELKALLSDANTFLTTALASPHYPTSAAGTGTLQDMYTRAHALFDPENPDGVAGPWRWELDSLSSEFEAFFSDLIESPHWTRLSLALAALKTHMGALGTDATAASLTRASRARSELVRDLFAYVLPRVGRVLGRVPVWVGMPRVEYADAATGLGVVVDSLPLVAGRGRGSGVGVSAVPDRVVVRSWNEVVWDFVGGGAENARTRTSVRIEGVRLNVRGIGYYLTYAPFSLPPTRPVTGSASESTDRRTPEEADGPNAVKNWLGWMGYTDEGVASLFLGGVGGRDVGFGNAAAAGGSREGDGGLGVELELESDARAWDTSPNREADECADDAPLFRVTALHAALPHLALSLDQSRHAVLNSLLVGPMAGSTPVRAVVGGVLEGVLRGWAEAGERWARGVVRGVRERRLRRVVEGLEEEGEWEDWWGSVMDSVSSAPDDGENDGDAEEGEVRVESHTEATMKGIIHTTTTIESSDADAAVTETVLTVGAGAQLYPGKGGPHHLSSTPTPTIGDVAQEEVDGVQRDVLVAAGKARDVAGEVGAQVVRAREDVEGAAGRLGAREGGERARRGWRSRAFDL